MVMSWRLSSELSKEVTDMNGKAIVTFALMVGAALAGCVQYRATCIAMVSDAGSSIHTRSKYRVESYEIEYEEGSLYTPALGAEFHDGESPQARMKESAERFQPGVFSREGIPVRIRGVCNSSEKRDGHLLNFLTLGTWPESTSIDSTWTYSIEIGDEMPFATDLTVTAELCTKRSYPPPTAWLVTIDGKEHSEDVRVFDFEEKYVLSVVSLDFRDIKKLESMRYEAVSYGLASCLKRFEDKKSGVETR